MRSSLAAQTLLCRQVVPPIFGSFFLKRVQYLCIRKICTSSTCLACNSSKLLSMLSICKATDQVRRGAPRLFCPITLLKQFPKNDPSFFAEPPVVSLYALKTDLKTGRPALIIWKMRMKFIQFQLSLLCTQANYQASIASKNHQKLLKAFLSFLDRKNGEVIMMSQKCRHIISQCLDQNQHFRKWDEAREYDYFHRSHYDWWAFPIDQPSSHGDKYQVDPSDLPFFLESKQFVNALRSNAVLVCRAWGYDLEKGCALVVVGRDQKWQNWPIRLYKMARSLELFQQHDLHRNAVRYGCSLIDKGLKFHYMRDLSAYFNAFRQIGGNKKNEKEVKKQVQNKSKKESECLNSKNIQRTNKYSYSVPKKASTFVSPFTSQLKRRF